MSDQDQDGNLLGMVMSEDGWLGVGGTNACCAHALRLWQWAKMAKRGNNQFSSSALQHSCTQNNAKMSWISEARTQLQAAAVEKKLAPALLRLALNDALTFDASTKTGGPNGSIRVERELQHPGNEGLDSIIAVIDGVKKTLDPSITYAGALAAFGTGCLPHASSCKRPLISRRFDSTGWYCGCGGHAGTENRLYTWTHRLSCESSQGTIVQRSHQGQFQDVNGTNWVGGTPVCCTCRYARLWVGGFEV